VRAAANAVATVAVLEPSPSTVDRVTEAWGSALRVATNPPLSSEREVPTTTVPVEAAAIVVASRTLAVSSAFRQSTSSPAAAPGPATAMTMTSARAALVSATATRLASDRAVIT
jgi:negative regulator of sigma E activity